MWTWFLVLAGILVLFYGLRVFRGGTAGPATGSGDQRTAAGQEDDGPGNPAVLGPDQTAVNPPESYVIHHEGKGQGMDIANKALKELTRHLTPDAPGPAGVRAKVPGRAAVVEEDLTGTAARESGEPQRDGQGPGGANRDGILDDGTAGRRISPAATHMEAAAELAYPYRPAPFVGQNKLELADEIQHGTREGARAEIQGRVIQIADEMKRGPTGSRPDQGDRDPAHGGATGERS